MRSRKFRDTPHPMLACLDVDYRTDHSVTACVAFPTWAADQPSHTQVTRTLAQAATYEPGAFYRRELPCLLDALQRLPYAPKVIVIDGYVWLAEGRPGLGAHLHAALNRPSIVVGVAKGAFRGANSAIAVLRGASKQPLYVTAAGMDNVLAAEVVRSMHGPHRIPTLLKMADRLARDG